MSNQKPFSNLASPIDLMVLNLRYIAETYLHSLGFFMLPYILSVVFLDKGDMTIQVLDYLGLSLWLVYGVYKTKQPKFVLTIGAIFITSEWAMYDGNLLLDKQLTYFCVFIIFVKQYMRRIYFAESVLLTDALESNSNSLKDNTKG